MKVLYGSGSQSMGCDQNKGGEGQKNRWRQAVQTWVMYLQRYHCLWCVCNIGTWEKSRLLTLKTNLATFCQKHPYNQYFFHFNIRCLRLCREMFTKLRFESRVLRSGLAPLCSNQPLWSRHEQTVTACLHQRTIFLFSAACNLLSYVAKEPHCL